MVSQEGLHTHKLQAQTIQLSSGRGIVLENAMVRENPSKNDSYLRKSLNQV
jgi:hypothetical protein